MSLRPRYSLLTLLILTALVAGGVKLWYGPHRFISAQEEYSYTRDWQGEQDLIGPRVSRTYSDSKELESISISYYRDGKRMEIGFYFWARRPGEEYLSWYPKLLTPEQNPLSAEEARLFDEVVDREKQKVLDLGLEVDGGYSDYYYDQKEIDREISEAFEQRIKSSPPAKPQDKLWEEGEWPVRN